MDPLAEKAADWTPNRYGFNNPIRFTDPDGMREDDFIVNEMGRIVRLGETSDHFDRLIKTDKKGNETNTLMRMNKRVLKESSDATLNKSKFKRNDYTIMQTTNNDEATDLFEFLAQNTSAEWGKIEMLGVSVVSTSHDRTTERSSGTIMLSLMNNGLFMNSNVFILISGLMKRHIHSHPNALQLGASGNYDGKEEVRSWGDQLFAEKIEEINSKIPLKVYHVGSGGTYFRYDSKRSLIR